MPANIERSMPARGCRASLPSARGNPPPGIWQPFGRYDRVEVRAARRGALVNYPAKATENDCSNLECARSRGRELGGGPGQGQPTKDRSRQAAGVAGHREAPSGGDAGAGEGHQSSEDVIGKAASQKRPHIEQRNHKNDFASKNHFIGPL